MTKQMTQRNQTHTAELQKRKHLGTVSRKTTGVLKSVLLTGNLALNSDATPNYKHVGSAHGVYT